jgi:hypothetical protein
VHLWPSRAPRRGWFHVGALVALPLCAAVVPSTLAAAHWTMIHVGGVAAIGTLDVGRSKPSSLPAPPAATRSPSSKPTGATRTATATPGSTGRTTPGSASQHGPPDDGSVGLVAVVALICILGVSVGIIRVIRAQRASRSLYRAT